MDFKIISEVCSVIGNGNYINQDNFSLNGISLSNIRSACDVYYAENERRGVFAVTDGMGGENNGELASAITAEEMSRLAQEENISESLVHEAINNANNRICAYMSEAKKACGATIALIAIDNNIADIYNIGDTRCYLIRNGNIKKLTKDHTAANQMVETGILTAEQAAKDSRRHELVQHLGIFPENMMLSVYHDRVNLEANDALLICSDGLYDVMEDNELCDIVGSSCDNRGIAQKLVMTALHHNSIDNITAMLLKISDNKKADETRLTRLLYPMLCVSAGLIGVLAAILCLLL